MHKDKLDREIKVADILLVAFVRNSSVYLEKRVVLGFMDKGTIKVAKPEPNSRSFKVSRAGFLSRSDHTVIIERDGKALI